MTNPKTLKEQLQAALEIKLSAEGLQSCLHSLKNFLLREGFESNKEDELLFCNVSSSGMDLRVQVRAINSMSNWLRFDDQGGCLTRINIDVIAEGYKILTWEFSVSEFSSGHTLFVAVSEAMMKLPEEIREHPVWLNRCNGKG